MEKTTYTLQMDKGGRKGARIFAHIHTKDGCMVDYLGDRGVVTTRMVAEQLGLNIAQARQLVKTGLVDVVR